MPRPRPALLTSLLLLSPLAASAGEVDVVQAAATVIEARLPDTVDHPSLQAAAIRGMTRWLDERTGVPGNALLTESEHRALQARLRGERVGLGLEYAVAAGRGLLVTEVFPGSPAASVELAPGDLVVALDDQPFTGMASPGIHQLVAGLASRSPGAPVVLDLRRADGSLRRLELVPGPFRAPGARVTMGDDRVVVRVEVIGPGTGEVVAAAVRDAGRRPVVLDLRDTAQGTVADVVGVADHFVSSGKPLLRAVDPAGRVDTSLATSPEAADSRLVVLVNRGTSGLAEALAAALRQHAGAPLVGTRTAGVASLPSFHPIGDGLVLQLADTSLFAGDGSSWAGEGLEVDLLVQPAQIPLVGPVRAAFPDMQLEAALRYLGAP